MEYSVIIPAYNAAKTIAETIESVLRQTVPPACVHVVDDGSTDDTRRIAQHFGDPVVVHSQVNQGPGAAMTLGMRHSETPFLASVDSDDLWLPKKMETQLAYLQEYDSIHGVFAKMELFGRRVLKRVVQDGWARSTMTIRREVFDRVGAVVDPPGMRGEMIDWIARARYAGFRMDMLPDVLARRRVHRGSLSDQRDPSKDHGYVFVARMALLRKRTQKQTVTT